MANSIFMAFNGFADQGGGSVSTPGSITAGSQTTGSFYAADGTVALPSYSFTSAPGVGFFLPLANAIGVTSGGVVRALFNSSAQLQFGSAYGLGWAGTADATGAGADLLLTRGAAGQLNIANTGSAIGVRLKVDALPTVASGFGTSPAVLAGSTPLAGAVNVGTGAPGSAGVINFNGTAFPSAPFCVITSNLTNAAQRAVASTTQLFLNTSTAWTASDVITWVCISSK